MLQPLLRAALALAILSAPVIARGDAPSSSQVSSQPVVSSKIQAVYQDIQQTLGIVPSFVKAVPDSMLPGVWQEAKSIFFNPNTALKARTKNLISLAVDGQIPCRYCSYWNAELAKLDGASPQQLQEAVAVASETRHWSTFLNGMQMDEAKFRRQTDQIMRFSKQHMSASSVGMKQEAGTAPITTPEQAYRDIRSTLGIVPDFLQNFPPEAIVGAWDHMKNFQMSPNTAISPKEKELMGLAVAGQVPCRYCAYFHTQAAKLHGASDLEIREAVAVASLSRQWSTILNGNLVDEPTFRGEVQAITNHLRAQQRAPQLGGQVGEQEE